jgi:hypothetical protein
VRQALILFLGAIVALTALGCGDADKGVNKNLDRPTNRASLTSTSRS